MSSDRDEEPIRPISQEQFDDVLERAGVSLGSPPKACILCGGPVTGIGHNPEPLASYDAGRCCSVCNDTKVIPARIRAMRRAPRIEPQ